MPQPMTRARASAIRAVGLSAGGLLLLGTGALAVSAGPDPAAIRPAREVKVPQLPAPQGSHTVYPDEIAAFISSAYRHEFPDETQEPQQTRAPAPPPGSPVRLVGVLGSGPGAMAIVGVDTQQLLLAAGESGSDFRIEEIHEDYIVMSRRGERSEIRLGERQGSLTADIRPGGGYSAGAMAGSQSADRGRAWSSAAGEDVRGGDLRGSRQADLEQRRRAAQAARALEMSGDDDGNLPHTVTGSGNSFSGAAAANGPTPGAAEGQDGQGGTQTRQPGARRGNGASNN